MGKTTIQWTDRSIQSDSGASAADDAIGGDSMKRTTYLLQCCSAAARRLAANEYSDVETYSLLRSFSSVEDCDRAIEALRLRRLELKTGVGIGTVV